MTRPQLARASPADLREANRRQGIINPHLAGMAAAVAATVPARTIRRWLARLRRVGHSEGVEGPCVTRAAHRDRQLRQRLGVAADQLEEADAERVAYRCGPSAGVSVQQIAAVQACGNQRSVCLLMTPTADATGMRREVQPAFHRRERVFRT